MPPRQRVLAMVKIQLPAGGARPRLRSGTALGPHGVQTMEFCKQYNAATENQRGTIIPVEITIYEDRSFTFILKTPPTPVLIREAAGLEKGAASAGREQVGTITDAQLDPDRDRQASRPQHRRHGGGQAPGRGHGALDGRSPSPAELADSNSKRKAKEPTVQAGQEVPKPPWSGFDRQQLLHARRGGGSREGARDRRSSTRPSSSPSASGSIPRKADQIVRGTLSLPHGTGRSVARGGVRRRRRSGRGPCRRCRRGGCGRPGG